VRKVVTEVPTEIAPTVEDLYRCQAIPAGTRVPDPVAELARTAVGRFQDLARPTAVVDDVTLDEFREIYLGEGRNDSATPLAEIYPAADRMALFAGTVGEELSAEIQGLFDMGDLALAVMVDAAASEGAERFVTVLERRFADQTDAHHRPAVLAYSPGYCGWHVSGQRRLFDALRPSETGITLNESCLMSPLKSVSGVLVAGRPEIHDFHDDFDCCAGCATRECRVRIERVLEV